jgi:hypothetical protein
VVTGKGSYRIAGLISIKKRPGGDRLIVGEKADLPLLIQP